MPMFYLWFATGLLLAPNTLSENVLHNITATDKGVYLTFTNETCTELIQKWHITVNESGVGLSVFLNQTSLNPDNEEYIVISRESEMIGGNSSVAYITGNQSNIALGLPMVNEAFLTVNLNNGCSENTDFTIYFKEYEKAPPVPPITTPNPNPPSGIRTEILIYLAGKTLSEFENPGFQAEFKSAIRNAAFNFSKVHNIQYEPDKAPNETVFLNSAQTCSDKWPDHENCVTVLMAVYVTKSRVDYELTITHLEQLWDQIQDSGLPASVGVQPYDFPNVSEEIGWWMLWIIIAVAITFLVAAVLWRVEKTSLELGYQRKALKDQIDLQKEHPDVIFRPKLRSVSKLPHFMLNNADAISVQSGTPPKSDKKLFKSKKASSTSGAASPPPSSSPSKFNFAKPLFSSKHFADDNEEIPMEKLVNIN